MDFEIEIEESLAKLIDELTGLDDDPIQLARTANINPDDFQEFLREFDQEDRIEGHQLLAAAVSLRLSSQPSEIERGDKLGELIEQMLDGEVLLDEAIREFENLYIKAALNRHRQHLARTALKLGISRNSLARRVKEIQKAKDIRKSSQTKGINPGN